MLKALGYQNPQGTKIPRVPKSPGYQPRAGPSCSSCAQQRALLGAFWHRPLQGIPKTTAQPHQRWSRGITPPAFELLGAGGSPLSPRSAPPPRGAQKELCSGGSQRAASPGVSFLLLLLLLHLQPQLSPWGHLTAAKGTGTALSLSLTQFRTDRRFREASRLGWAKITQPGLCSSLLLLGMLCLQAAAAVPWGGSGLVKHPKNWGWDHQGWGHNRG